jgi:universal stress protein A
MAPLHTILHPTDFSPRAECALQLACALARDYGARLVLLHVAPSPPLTYGEGVMPVDTGAYLREARDQLAALQLPADNVRAERRFESGEPALEIVRVAKDLKADLIVMGTHGRSGLSRILMGSTAEKVLRQATCPVLTMKMPLPDSATVPVACPEALPREALA